MLYYARGGAALDLSEQDLREAVLAAFDKIGRRKKVLALPPDITRAHSRAGDITRLAFEYYGGRLADIMPALGTHAPMSEEELARMFGDLPRGLFRVHDWRNDLVTLGRVPADFVRRVSGGKLDWDWPAQVNSLLVKGGHDLILSIGQVVPHEVIGLANYNKNIFVGTGGQEGINKSHYLGAVVGMEKIMGRRDNPVRELMNYASREFARQLPIVYVLTVLSRAGDGRLALRGLYVGDDDECFNAAAALSAEVNVTRLNRPIDKAVVYLDPGEYKSTWLGNKSVYRTRMALADNGQLLVLAPGLKEFGEDRVIDGLIRKYGYRGTPRTLEATAANHDLQDNLGAAAHLIHGSSEGRFSITYCPGVVSRAEIEGVGFKSADLAAMQKRYDPAVLKDGWNRLGDGEEFYYISNPAVGLWAWDKKFA